MFRPLAERLIHDLTQIRGELHEFVDPIPDSELDYAPAAGMKSYRRQLIEIGAMLAESTILLTEGRLVDYKDCEVLITGDTVDELMQSLDVFHTRLVDRLKSAPESWFQETIAIPEDWVPFFGTSQIEPEELVRWVARHEYYHLGQIVTYRWIRGYNPYKA